MNRSHGAAVVGADEDRVSTVEFCMYTEKLQAMVSLSARCIGHVQTKHQRLRASIAFKWADRYGYLTIQGFMCEPF
jgi:hypothetical protein